MTNRPPYLVERSPGYLEYQLPISVKLVVDEVAALHMPEPYETTIARWHQQRTCDRRQW